MKNDIVWLLVGLIVPVYCAGHARLIHIARADADLYRVIEKYAIRFLWLAIIFFAVCIAIFIAADWNNANRYTSFVAIFLAPLLLALHAWRSRSFFRAITEIQPQNNPNDKPRPN